MNMTVAFLAFALYELHAAKGYAKLIAHVQQLYVLL